MSDSSPLRAVETMKLTIESNKVELQEFEQIEPYKTKEGTIEERIDYVREKLQSPPFGRKHREKSKEKAINLTAGDIKQEEKEKFQKNLMVSKIESPKDKLRNSPVDWNTVEFLKKRVLILE